MNGGSRFSLPAYFPKWSGWIFTLLFLGSCLLYEFPSTFHKRPQGPHEWRQTDCLSLTLNYYKENRPLLDPGVNYLGNDNTGRGVSEFPILYYLVAQIWKVTGQNEGIFRLLTLSIVFFGLLGLMKSAEWILENSYWAMSAVFVLWGAPFLIFYGFTFIADPAGLGFGLMGLFCFVWMLKSGKRFWYAGFLILFALAGLIKISATIHFFAAAGLIGLRALGMWPESRFSRRDAWIALALMLPVLYLWKTWYTWADAYNVAHNSGLFLVGILPIWEADKEKFRQIFDAVWNMWRDQYFSPVVEAGSIFLLGCYFGLRRNLPSPLFHFTLFWFLGFLAYLAFFFRELNIHDYHVLNLSVFVPILMVSVLAGIKNRWPRLYTSPGLLSVGLLFTLASVIHGKRQNHARYHDWWNGNHLRIFQCLEDIEPWLREKGLSRSDTVLSIPDQSLNISLYLMDQKGWTDFSPLDKEEKVRSMIQRGAKYLISADSNERKRPALQPFLKEKLGTRGQVELYRLALPEDSIAPPIP